MIRVRAFFPVMLLVLPMLPLLPHCYCGNFFSLHSQGISNLKLCEIIAAAAKEKTKNSYNNDKFG